MSLAIGILIVGMLVTIYSLFRSIVSILGLGLMLIGSLAIAVIELLLG